jgi:hypothetical protein
MLGVSRRPAITHDQNFLPLFQGIGNRTAGRQDILGLRLRNGSDCVLEFFKVVFYIFYGHMFPVWLLAGGWRLAAGGWRLAAGGWRLAAGGWRLAASGERLSAIGYRLSASG